MPITEAYLFAYNIMCFEHIRGTRSRSCILKASNYNTQRFLQAKNVSNNTV